MINTNRPVQARPWTRWQDWCNAVLGAILFASPWFLVAWEHASSSWNAWIVGAAIVIVALWALAMPALVIPEWINLILGIWLFISPWVLGYALMRTDWFAWVIGVLVALISLSTIVMRRAPSARPTV